MKQALVPGLLLSALLAPVCGPAAAQAWTQPRNGGLVILKFEPMRADQAFDEDGTLLPIVSDRDDDTIALFAQYGLTDAFTLQLKADLQRGEDVGVSYEGAGPIEIGIVSRLYRGPRTAVSLYAGYAHGGGGRGSVYSAPGEGGSDAEVRLSIGTSRPVRRLGGAEAFLEIQTAVRLREDLADEARVDVTAGLHLGANWMLLTQGYAGATEDRTSWLTSETSIVRRFGSWNLQAGWRQTLAGRNAAALEGPVIAIWRRF